MFQVEFDSEKTIEVEQPGLTLLEISLSHEILHIHICGGNARCSTCRVRILENPENLEAPTPAEIKLSREKGFPEDVRLACQAKANGPVKVKILLVDERDISIALSQGKGSGFEKKVAVLFSDIRNFTSFSEKQLPYDIIHILNRYFNEMGDAILRYGGFIDKFIGDGIMAIFGIEDDTSENICRNAVLSALEMSQKLTSFNDYLKSSQGVQFKIGIGIHFGKALIGEVGHVSKHSITAIGDTVNTASRIESATKKAGSEILISEDVYRLIAGEIHSGRTFGASLKGKTGNFLLYEVLGMKNSLAGKNLKAHLYELFSQFLPYSALPQFLRLAFHDAGTFDVHTKKGGANGSIQLDEELKREANQGLGFAVQVLREMKKSTPETSMADLIAFAGAYAVWKLGGPDMDLRPGRKDSFEISPDGMMPDENDSLEKLIESFSRMGLTLRDLVVLSGAHSVGKAHGKPITEDFMKFTNSYYRALLMQYTDQNLLASDHILLENPESRKMIEEYAVDQDKFFSDFALSYKKMSELGAVF